MSSEEDGDVTIIQRDFRDKAGNGLQREVQFVKAQHPPLTSESTSTTSAAAIGENYLALVLPATHEADSRAADGGPAVCEVCHLPLRVDDGRAAGKSGHDNSIAHQVCLRHTHPPSALDRRRKGLVYLEAYGWDPDGRRGLGSASEGILYPIKPKEKKDRAGIGAPEPLARKSVEAQPKVQKVNAKQARKMAAKDKETRERLQRMFYADEKVEKYLGPDAW
jgi:hypothetical protein